MAWAMYRPVNTRRDGCWVWAASEEDARAVFVAAGRARSLAGVARCPVVGIEGLVGRPPVRQGDIECRTRSWPGPVDTSLGPMRTVTVAGTVSWAGADEPADRHWLLRRVPI
jgi:hypothetical protein